jgi:activator of HSP90 ATPase
VPGENVELVAGEKIVQKWRFTNWADGVYSTVTISLKEPEPGNTILTLVQTGVPEEDKFGNHNVKDQTENGWQNLIFGRIRQVFGFGC